LNAGFSQPPAFEANLMNSGLQRSFLLYLLLLLPGAFYYLLGGSSSRSGYPEDHFAHLGTWTDPDGEPGNSIRFFMRRCPEVGSVMGIEAWEGRADFHKHFGRE
jgi:hypothetical protein